MNRRHRRILLGTTGFFQRALGSVASKDDAEMGGAFLGGLASGVPCSVWELTMIQQQRFGGSILGTPTGILRNFGGAGLLRGLTMTLGRESLFTMAMLGVTPQIQRKLVDSSGMDKQVALAAGALTGAFFSATVTHPMDTIKTCLQGDLERTKYGGVLDTGKSLAAEYGVVQGLFKGLSFRISLIATTCRFRGRGRLTSMLIRTDRRHCNGNGNGELASVAIELGLAGHGLAECW